MLQLDKLALLQTSINQLTDYARVLLKQPIYCLLEINPFLGDATKIFQSKASWLVSISDFSDNIDYRGLLEGMDMYDIQTEFNNIKFPDHVIHEREDPIVLLKKRTYCGIADMAYINCAPGRSRITSYINELISYKNIKIISGYGYDWLAHPITYQVIDSILGTPDMVFPDSSWIKKISS